MEPEAEFEQIEKRDLEARETLHSYAPSLLVWLVILVLYVVRNYLSHWLIVTVYTVLLAWMILVQLRGFQILICLRGLRQPFVGLQLRNSIFISIFGLFLGMYLAVDLILVSLPVAWIAIVSSAIVVFCVNEMFPNLRRSSPEN